MANIQDLTIKGPGKLIVKGNDNNGIGSRANLIIEGGDISVNTVKNALIPFEHEDGK